ncbi:unnamed protein product [Rotaria magnacalcarata]|uniref:N-acetyltransferase domain-containing protein n=1 Tax=Rotaria magnacalcarata TaxID=392030 RepID=A0A816D0M3_9BILA|nr:unnamed protein product [Rotaria magnacalcarata]CAF1964995.1 unnamed protein product [Rotaria magnacalcarata]CAF4132339.1 unnamed protein product [Rotaria magnacalcarata]CAF4171247.1 unnamed protein product [Rotaria magnacalcarata]
MNQPKLIGVLINVIENVNEEKNVFDGPQSKSGKLRYVMKLLADAHVVVDENYRGLNLTGRLMNLSVELAKMHGNRAAFDEATGFYSTKSMLKQGFEVYNELIYVKYDQKRLSNLGIHDRCSLIAKSL